MALPRAEADIDRGIAADEVAIYGSRRPSPATPFFRFPGFVSSQALLNRMGERRDDRIGVWVRRPDKGEGYEDKIAAIGIRVKQWVTLHGMPS